MRAKPDYLTLRRYRLPTEAEWEFACRAGAITSLYYGPSESMLENYAWYLANGERRTSPVGSLKPNELGLFDMHGNAYEWCHERFTRYATPKNDEQVEDLVDIESVSDGVSRVLRGGSFVNYALVVRSA
jgi:formylglycine-generating enzyme required for sulfatase activity